MSRLIPDRFIVLVVAVVGLGCICPASPADERGREDFCALTLNVIGADGIPATSTLVELVDSQGKVVRREFTRGPVLKICDFGFGPHTLRVGVNEYHQVTISGLELQIGYPLNLTAVINDGGFHGTRSGCFLYVRTTTSGGKPLPHVSISSRLASSVQTDGYGRWQRVFNGKLEINFTKLGYQATTKQIQCQEDEAIDLGVEMPAESGETRR